MACNFYGYRNPGFCEGQCMVIRNLIGEGSYTEVGGAISSLIGLTVPGLIGLFYNPAQGILIRALWAMMTVTGIGSFLYHGSGNVGMGSLDGIPMLLMISLGLSALCDECVNEFAKKRNVWKGVGALFVACYTVASIMAEQYDDTGKAFQAFFGVPFAGFIAITIAIWYKVEDFIKAPIPEQELKIIRNILIRSWSIGSISLVVWLLDQHICEQSKCAMVWGHWVWHLGIGYYGVCIFTVINYIRANNVNERATIEYKLCGYWPYSKYIKKVHQSPTVTRGLHSRRNTQDSYYDSTTYSISNSSYDTY